VIRKLSADEVRRRCDPAAFPFETTAALTYADVIYGQPRAVRALDFGISIEAPGYNVFVVGPNGTGRMSAILKQVRAGAASRAVPSDWVYVHNFANARAPVALRLKPGAASKLRDAMDRLIRQTREKLPLAFETDQYDDATDAITVSLHARHDEELSQVQAQAEAAGLTLIRTATGLDIAPAQPDAQVTPELTNARRQISDTLDDALRHIREAEKDARARLEALDANVAESVVGVLVHDIMAVQDELVESNGRDALMTFLSAVKQDLVEHLAYFKPREEAIDPTHLALFLNRYRVNVFVENCVPGAPVPDCGAPVVAEENPTYYNLIGRIDRTLTISNNPLVAASTVDHMMLRPGAFHRANGGFLVLGARDLLDADFAQAALKRTLKSSAIRIEEPNEGQIIGAPTLEPQPIPLAIKVILHGNGPSYWETNARDEAFADLFKVKAEFVSQMDRSPDSETAYANFLRARSEEDGLPPFDREAVAWLVEQGSRMVDDQKKMTTRFGALADLAREAAFWARRAGRELVTRADFRTALDERRVRLNRYEDDTREYMMRGGYHIATSGEEVGQVNGMSVIELGEYEFGKPARITARSYVMRGGINDVDRSVNYTDASHNKGIALVDSYLTGVYSAEQYLAVSANITFEQSLNHHEGDSASCAILLAMLSSVSSQPLPQSIALTGTLDQFGFVRPIGGASTKIEGFFDVCAARGLDGLHGAVVPIANMDDLMLREDVVEAVREGKFHVYAAAHVDDLIELFFGMPAGRRMEDNRFPPGSLHSLVEAALRDINDKLDGRRRGGKDDEKAQDEKKSEPEGAPAAPPPPPPAPEPPSEPVPVPPQPIEPNPEPPPQIPEPPVQGE
jgi:predicted ATP-dependent protease